MWNSTDRDCPRNAYMARSTLSNTQNTIFIASLGIIIPIIFGTNAFLAYALFKTKQLHSSFIILLFHLCISNCFAATVVLPLNVVIFTTFRNEHNCIFELTLVFIQQFGSHLSIYTVLALALLRYCQVNPEMITPKGLKKRMISRSGTIFFIVTSFVMSIIHGLASNYLFGSYNSRIPNWIIKGIDVGLFVLVLFAYFRLFLRVKIYTETSAVLQRPSENVDNSSSVFAHNQRPRYFARLTVTVFLTVASTVLFSIPFIITDALTAYYKDFQRTSSVQQLLQFFYYYSWVILSVDLAINALLFIFSNRKVKAFCRGICE